MVETKIKSSKKNNITYKEKDEKLYMLIYGADLKKYYRNISSVVSTKKSIQKHKISSLNRAKTIDWLLDILCTNRSSD